jgi:pimeloyl-ACP methyl ester carboxylesterase
MLRNSVFVASITLILSIAAFAETPHAQLQMDKDAKLNVLRLSFEDGSEYVFTREATTAPSAESGPAQEAASGVATSGDFASLVDIGGRRLYLACKGSGTPTVILEAGAGNNGDIWSMVEPEAAGKISVFEGVAEFTRVCAYDRPGTVSGSKPVQRSRSDPAPKPRSAGDIVADLRALLVAAGVRPPYVLVGHSFGGLVVRLFASTVPDEVVGLVLVDAAQEEFWTKLKALVTPEQWQGMITGTPPELATTGTSKNWTSMRARSRCAGPRPRGRYARCRSSSFPADFRWSYPPTCPPSCRRTSRPSRRGFGGIARTNWWRSCPGPSTWSPPTAGTTSRPPSRIW